LELLNIGLEGYPTSVVKMDLARKEAVKVINNFAKLTKDDKKVIQQQMHTILTPLQEFFDNIRGYASMVRPLVEESLLGEGVVRKADGTLQHNSILLKFFEKENKDNVDVFFDKHVCTRADLLQVCNELITFVDDVHANLSEKALSAYNAIMQKLKDQARKKQSQKK
jgi:hypothetical protein